MNAKNDINEKANVTVPLDNVCMFADTYESDSSEPFTPTRFIYETYPEKLGAEIMYSAFGCHLVTGGSAKLVTEMGVFELEVGDMFFAFPMIPFSFCDIKGLKYLYINFIGTGAEQALISYQISRGNNVFKNKYELIDIWFLALGRCNSENLHMLGKGVLYYSLAMFPFEAKDKPDQKQEDIAELIRKSIDISYYNEDLSIEYYAKKYQYNSKYLSRKFALAFDIPFSEYLKTCRIGHACSLLENTEKSIQDVASSVGYHDPLYFSKVFRSITGKSPTQYRIDKKKNPED